jgi:5-methylcytosine-specific restriction endonuclease McrA
MQEDSLGIQNKKKFYDSGQTLPICSNDGCNNFVVVRDWKYYSFKHHCSDCLRRIQRGLDPRDGVVFHKKNYCENKDGRLGFICPVDPTFNFPNNVLHDDHVNGDHYDNSPSNLMTLCSICHAIKGLKSGDFVSARKGRKLNF